MRRNLRQHFSRPFLAGNNLITNVYKVGENLTRAGIGLIQIIPTGTNLKTGWTGTIYYSAKAVGNLYSAVFGSAGILLTGRKHKGGATIAAGTLVVAAGLAWHQGHLNNISSMKIPSFSDIFTKTPKRVIVKLPKGTSFFSDKRSFTLSSLVQNSYLFNPHMQRKYQKSARVRKYVDLIVAEAKKNNIDPVLFANQLFQESIGFRYDVVSGSRNSNKGAVGIAQFLPSTARRLYGVKKADLKNWRKAIPLAAKHMGVLTKRYNGDQILAMIAYNAGDETNNPRKNPIMFVQSKLGQSTITGAEWMAYMKERRSKLNKRAYFPHAWHNETFKYVAIITNVSWSQVALKDAQILKHIRVSSVHTANDNQFAMNDIPVTHTPVARTPYVAKLEVKFG